VTINVWLSARVLLDGFGEDAAFQAGFHADERLASGDLDGARAWRAVIRAIREMQREPRDGERLN
jgi:hypothetical protein